MRTRRAGGRPTKREAEEIGARILDTAAALFARQGFAATTMEQVAAACGAGKDTLYRRFPSKDALFAALLRQLHTCLLPELDRAANFSEDPLVNLRHYARTILRINMRRDLLALNRVALGEAMAFGGVKPVAAREDPVMGRFVTLVETAQRAGVFTSGEADFIAEQLLYATSIRPVIAAMQGDLRYVDEQAQDAYFARAWALFLAGATPRRDAVPSPDRGYCSA